MIRRRNEEITVRVLNVPATRNVSRRESNQLITVVSQRHLEPLSQ